MPVLSRIRHVRWASALLSVALSVGVLSLAASPAAAEVDEPDAPASASEPPAGGTVLVSEDFSSGVLPDGWAGKAGAWSVADGRLQGEGPAYAADPTRLVFGSSVPEFRFDATVRFESVVNTGRWGGLILDHSSTEAAPWQHALMRANGSAVGFGKRAAGNGGWDGSDILGSAPPAGSPIVVGEDVRMTVVVRGTHGEWWYRAGDMEQPVKLAETDALVRQPDGLLGFVLDGARMSFDDVVVTDLNPEATACRPYRADLDAAAEQGAIGDVVFSESFDDDAGVGCWATDGDWRVEGGELVGTSSVVGAPATVSFGPHLTNYRLEAAVRVDAVAGDDGTISFGADVPPDGGPWPAAALRTDAVSSGDRVKVRVDVQGQAATYYADGAVVATEALPPRSADGVPGIAIDGATAAVDDIVVTKLAAPAAQCIPAGRVPAPGETGTVVAHRGNDGDDGIADNLIPGYARSFAKGAEHWESDIHLTTDGVPVVRHDGIGAITLDQFRETYPGLPTLEEVLQFQRDSRSSHVLEYKGSWTQDGATIVRDLLHEYGVWEDVISQSFDMTTLDNIRAVDPDMPVMWLTGSISAAGDPVSVSEQHGLLGINPSVHPTAAQVAAMHEAGRKVFVWTQNSPAQWAALTALGVDGVITDHSGALVDWYRAYNADRGLETCRDVTVEVSGAGTAVADVERQAAGKPVVVTAEPAEGHHLAELTGTSPAGLELDGGAFVMPTQRTWVRAEFAPNAWSIAYDANGGSGGPAATSHVFGDESVLATADLTRDGYAFEGWATSPEATEPAFADASPAAAVTTENGAAVTLYAVWTAAAPPDTTAPTVTVKTGGADTVGRDGVYRKVSFTLHDAGRIDRITLNGVEKDLADDVWSDLNGVEPGVFGARAGRNELKVYDVAGNATTVVFTLDATAPTVTVKDGAAETIGEGGVYEEVSFKLHDAGKVDRVVINGTVKDLTDNAWSDVNGVRPGVFGATLGENTLEVHDVAGNVTTVTFTLVAAP